MTAEFDGLADKMKRNAEPLRQLIIGMDDIIKRVGNSVLEVAGPLAHFMERWLDGEALFRIGWLPHPIIEGIDHQQDPVELDASVQRILLARWSELRSNLVASAEAVDFAAGAVLRDALELHESGHYRAVCRLLFPELERLVRRRLKTNGFRPETQLRSLRTRLTQVPLQEHLPTDKLRVLWLFHALEGHLFEKVEDPDALSLFESSGIPNRHACIHGLIDYSTFQHSYNVLLISVYVMEMVELVIARTEENPSI